MIMLLTPTVLLMNNRPRPLRIRRNDGGDVETHLTAGLFCSSSRTNTSLFCKLPLVIELSSTCTTKEIFVDVAVLLAPAFHGLASANIVSTVLRPLVSCFFGLNDAVVRSLWWWR